MALGGHGRRQPLRTAGAGIGPDDVAHFDLYSCFASSVSFALDALGVDHDPFVTGERAVTITGGLPYHGGPGSAYMTHSMAAMASACARPRQFRSGERRRHAHDQTRLRAVVEQHRAPRPGRSGALADKVRRAQPVGGHHRQGDRLGHGGHLRVLHGRDRLPEWGALVCDLADGTRCYARLEELGALAVAEEQDLVGRTVTLSAGENGATIASL